MKHKKILGIIERSRGIRRTGMRQVEKKTKYAGFSSYFTHMLITVFDYDDSEYEYLVRLSLKDKKYFKERIDDKGWRSFSASVDKLNNGSLKMIVDSHMYM